MTAEEYANQHEKTDGAAGLEGPTVVLVVMGVSGSGKTTVGRVIAKRLSWPFFEGDEMHPRANVEKMESGDPLGDHDRQPWLEEIRKLAARLLSEERSGVIACSALKRAYRELIAADAEDATHFLYLDGSYEQIAERLRDRDNHYMPAELLESQFSALEEPDPDEENTLAIDIDQPPEAIADKASDWLRDREA